MMGDGIWGSMERAGTLGPHGAARPMGPMGHMTHFENPFASLPPKCGPLPVFFREPSGTFQVQRNQYNGIYFCICVFSRFF